METYWWIRLQHIISAQISHKRKAINAVAPTIHFYPFQESFSVLRCLRRILLFLPVVDRLGHVKQRNISGRVHCFYFPTYKWQYLSGKGMYGSCAVLDAI